MFSRPQEGFLLSFIKESLVISQDMHNALSWTNIRKEKLELMISMLMDERKFELQSSTEDRLKPLQNKFPAITEDKKWENTAT